MVTLRSNQRTFILSNQRLPLSFINLIYLWTQVFNARVMHKKTLNLISYLHRTTCHLKMKDLYAYNKIVKVCKNIYCASKRFRQKQINELYLIINLLNCFNE